jgi:hypothetical protein
MKFERIKCPPQESISHAVRVLADQALSVYQLLYYEKLASPYGRPLRVSRYENTVLLKVSYPEYEDSHGLYFLIRGDEPEEEILEKSRMLLKGKDMQKIDKRACCPYAKKVFCVCEIRFECPLHGSKCIGSHD